MAMQFSRLTHLEMDLDVLRGTFSPRWLRRAFSGALMLANRLLWRFSADKSSGAAKKESLWGSITIFRPQVGRVTGNDLQNYSVLPPSTKS